MTIMNDTNAGNTFEKLPVIHKLLCNCEKIRIEK